MQSSQVSYRGRVPALVGIVVGPPSRCESKENKTLNYRNACITGLLAACLALAGVVVAQRSNIDTSLHPSLAEAQQHILEASQKIREAHERDKNNLGGHAEKAIQLLDQASMEVKSASELEHASHK